mmetsp:Transcript_13977/g.33500  ORF Transcript_13977/g.33500 Transcript_13977/m.33500 type:complete len:232 (-) Transcript_13977:706-1401(-)
MNCTRVASLHSLAAAPMCVAAMSAFTPPPRLTAVGACAGTTHCQSAKPVSPPTPPAGATSNATRNVPTRARGRSTPPSPPPPNSVPPTADIINTPPPSTVVYPGPPSPRSAAPTEITGQRWAIQQLLVRRVARDLNRFRLNHEQLLVASTDEGAVRVHDVHVQLHATWSLLASLHLRSAVLRGERFPDSDDDAAMGHHESHLDERRCLRFREHACDERVTDDVLEVLQRRS